MCAHRYIRKGADYQWGQGLCYTLTQDLEYDETWEPCRGRPTTWYGTFSPLNRQIHVITPLC